ASCYRGASILRGYEVTHSRFIDEIRAANIVHFAGHALNVPDRPLDSALIVAPDKGVASVAASDIMQLHLNHILLVFLSTCRSAESGGRRDGVQNLATAFLVAGAPTIVASISDVEDQSARRLATAFHSKFATSDDAASALHEAAVQSGDYREHPSTFRMYVLGGSRRFVGH
ncbi:MAG TPA: CHAT domain-containing protein, partial [Thermoanaerobaculia bacterium]|nr:CHAT domain-containing protein [Thermoanaerobaculia bacterium]